MPAAFATPAAPSRAIPMGAAFVPQDTPGVPPLFVCPFHPMNPAPGFNSRPAIESAAGLQLTVIWEFCAKSEEFQAAIAVLANGDSSANPGARNEVPQAPRIVRP